MTVFCNFWLTLVEKKMIPVAWILLVIILGELEAAEVSTLEHQMNVVVGSTVTLPCVTNLSTSVDWQYHWSPVDSPDRVFGNGDIFEHYKTRISVNQTTKGDYGLTIRDAMINNTGLYTCIEDGGLGAKHTASLVVTRHATAAPRSPMSLSSSPSPTNTTLLITTVLFALLSVVEPVAIVVYVRVRIRQMARDRSLPEAGMSDGHNASKTVEEAQLGLLSDTTSANKQQNKETSKRELLLESQLCEEKQKLELLSREYDAVEMQLVETRAFKEQLNDQVQKLKAELQRAKLELERANRQPTPHEEILPEFELANQSETGGEVRGVCMMGDRLFVARDGHSDIVVYDKQTMQLLGDRLSVTGEGSDRPCCMAGDTSERTLYITYYRAKIVRRVQVTDKRCTEWGVSDEPDGVAVMPSHNVLVVLRDERQLVEFEPSGQLIKTISLESPVALPRYAMPFGSDQFLVCYGVQGRSQCGVCVANSDGKVDKAVDSQTEHPLHLAKGPNGSVLVADFGDEKVAMFDANLDYMFDVVEASCGINKPFRVCYDEKSEQLFVGEFSSPYRVLSFIAKRGSIGE